MSFVTTTNRLLFSNQLFFAVFVLIAMAGLALGERAALSASYRQIIWPGPPFPERVGPFPPRQAQTARLLSHGRMGAYNQATEIALETGSPADIAGVRKSHNRAGVSLNLEQQITEDVGAFARAGWAQGIRGFRLHRCQSDCVPWRFR